MEMRKCSRGHYYDASIHADCPYCSNAGNTEMTMAMGVTPSIQASAGVTVPIQRGPVDATVPMGMSPVSFDEDDNRTVAVLMTEEGVEPVVGWMIGLTGKNKGKEYRIHSDNNFVGRSEKMDICIKNDDTISRENQAILTYDSAEKMFYLSPGSGRSIVKVNGKAVFQTTELAGFDRILLGKTEFVFLPLCGENFTWEDE
ncbi:MAG: FHA domain-containing protein [Lachnospiraceae bacterium]|jgi:hypothetical protein|nr:FHA domain-containing protein [Lachnospiraceae bacterium]